MEGKCWKQLLVECELFPLDGDDFFPRLQPTSEVDTVSHKKTEAPGPGCAVCVTEWMDTVF